MTKLDRLISKLLPEMRDAFRAAMDELRNGVDFNALEAALEAGDIERAIAALNIDAGAFNNYVVARTTAYAQAGTLAAEAIPTIASEAIAFRFDMTNPRAEAWIRTESATRVVGYTAEQVEAARKVIVDGYVKGSGPRQIAVDIAGRVDRVTGRRAGGIIGLSDPQSEYVQSVRELLKDDPRALFVRDSKTGQLRPRYTRMDGRDLRTIKARLRSGKPLTQVEIDKIAGRYSDRLLSLRAETVARTETAGAVMNSRAEAYQQALGKEGLPDEALTKIWRHQGDEKDARLDHIAMNGVRVQGINGLFLFDNGVAKKFAHDGVGGAEQDANCKCETLFEINFGWGLK